MRHLSAYFTVIAFSLAASSPVLAGGAEFRAFWADAFSPGYKSSQQIDDMITRALSGRYNAIIMEVLAFHDNVGTGHGAYWDSAIVPRAADISGGIDPLADVVAQAHAAGIEVHAWIVPYRVSSNWPPSGNTQLTSHPEWFMTSREDMGSGPSRVEGHYVLDPGSPDAQEYLTAIVRELVTNYEIDGINLDYIRYVTTNAGYPADTSYEQSTLARFRRIEGFVGTPNATGVTSWNDFRRRTITEFVRRLRGEVPAITSNPRQPLRLTADLIAFGDAPTNFTSTSAYILHQNWRFWMEQGYLDLGIPMNYKREQTGQQATWYRNWVDRSLQWKGPRHIAAGQGNYLNRREDSIAQLSYALNAGTDGVVNFAYDATADQNLDGVPEQDWSWYPLLGNQLFVTPAPTPTMPWRNPATATEGTLWGRVVDDLTGDGIDDALVDVAGIGSVRTDANGYYIVTLIPATAGGANVSIAISSSGCPDINTNATIFPAGLTRADVRVCPTEIQPGDMNRDGAVNAADLNLFFFCFRGVGFVYPDGNVCLNGDSDEDADVDMVDLHQMQKAYGQ